MNTDFTTLARNALIAEFDTLRQQIRQLAEPLGEDKLWQKPIEPGNSIGHLILHLTGNLNHFVGAHLGKTGYVRDREREFTDAHPPAKDKVLADFDAAVAMVGRVVGGLSAEQLAAPHPEQRFGTVYRGLVHLLSHFAMHRGQMSYIVRMLG